MLMLPKTISSQGLTLKEPGCPVKSNCPIWLMSGQQNIGCIPANLEGDMKMILSICLLILSSNFWFIGVSTKKFSSDWPHTWRMYSWWDSPGLINFGFQCLTLIHRTNSLTKNASLYNHANFKSPTDNLRSLTWWSSRIERVGDCLF